MIEITPSIAIHEDEIEVEFVRASGPGGQNVNKVATAAQVRFDAAHSPNLPEEVRQRLLRLAGSRATAEGAIVIRAQQGRTQHQNREAAIAQLVDLIRRATKTPKARRKTKPSAASQQRRMETKRRRGEVKRLRHTVDPER